MIGGEFLWRSHRHTWRELREGWCNSCLSGWYENRSVFWGLGLVVKGWCEMGRVLVRVWEMEGGGCGELVGVMMVRWGSGI